MKKLICLILFILLISLIKNNAAAENTEAINKDDFASYSYGLDIDTIESYIYDEPGFETYDNGGPAFIEPPLSYGIKPGDLHSYSYNPDETYDLNNRINIDYSFSEPVITIDRQGVSYQTTLTVYDIDSFYGYQIQIVSDSEDSVVIDNRAGGVITPAVYKNEKQNLACIIGEGMAGDLEICDIVVVYPHSETNKDRTLVVEKLDIISSIIAEDIVSFGPNPPALVISLPYVEPPFFSTYMYHIIIGALIILAGIVYTVRFFNKRKMIMQ